MYCISTGACLNMKRVVCAVVRMLTVRLHPTYAGVGGCDVFEMTIIKRWRPVTHVLLIGRAYGL